MLFLKQEKVTEQSKQSCIPAVASLNFVWLAPSTWEQQETTQVEMRTIWNPRIISQTCVPYHHQNNVTHTCCVKPTNSWVRSNCDRHRHIGNECYILWQMQKKAFDSSEVKLVDAYHFKQPSEQETHTHGLRTGKIQLIAQSGSENKIIQIWKMKETWCLFKFCTSKKCHKRKYRLKMLQMKNLTLWHMTMAESMRKAHYSPLIVRFPG